MDADGEQAIVTNDPPAHWPDPAEIRVNGARLLADVSGALIWPERRALVFADLHLEKGSSFAARGRPLPPYDSGATIRRMRDALTHHTPETVICLGDSFHDGDGPARLGDGDRRALLALTSAYDWVWIAGNHDPAPALDLGGRVAAELVLGGLLFRHAAAQGAAPAGEVSGHYHPKAAVRARGRRLSARCFVSDGRRLILPAFGAYTGGLNVLDPAIRRLFARPLQAHLLGRGRIIGATQAALVG